MRDSYMFYTDQLNAEYRGVFDQVEMYVSTENIDEITREEQLSELLDIFLSAQEAGKPVQSIVGHDIEKFCKTFCSDYGFHNKAQNLFDTLKTLAKGMVLISLLDILFLFLDWADGIVVDFWGAFSSLNVSGYLMGILLAIVLGQISNFIVRRVMFQSKRISMKVLKAITLVVAGATFVLAFCFTDSGKTNLFPCPVWVLLACGIVYLAIYYPLNYKRLREHSKQKVRFRDLVSMEMDKDFPDTMDLKYMAANKRSIKKGKGELSMEAFLEKEEKDCRLTEKTAPFYYLFPIVITAAGALAVEFEGYMDALFYIAIMLVIEYAIMIGFWKIVKKGVVQRRAWIQSKREEIFAENREKIE